jgi:hypothetical protein
VDEYWNKEFRQKFKHFFRETELNALKEFDPERAAM